MPARLGEYGGEPFPGDRQPAQAAMKTVVSSLIERANAGRVQVELVSDQPGRAAPQRSPTSMSAAVSMKVTQARRISPR